MARYVVHCKKEPYDVYIGRPGPWGNKFTVAEYGRGYALELYKDWVKQQPPEWFEKVKTELKGKVLGCWCHPKSCHGDVLSEIANG